MQITGSLVKIDAIMIKVKHIGILIDNLKDFAKGLNLGRRWTLRQNNDPKCTSNLVKTWPKTHRIDIFI